MSEHAIARHQVQRPATARDLIVPPTAAVLVVMVIGLVAAAVSPAEGRGAILFCVSVAALLVGFASTVAVRNRQTVRELRGRVVALETRASRSAAQTERLAREVLPAVVERLREGSSVQTALGEAPRGTEGTHQHILRTVAEEVSRGERMRGAAMAACANAAGRMQALSTSMLADLRAMEERHSEEVLGDLLRLDHLTAQAGRLADSIAVLTGGRSGRRWTKPIVMESLLRGSMGRISAYQRVRLHSVSAVAVVGYAAEGIMHALAELMDNATSFSPPSEEVHVYVEEVQAGVVITIEDGGLVMGPAALERAERAVSAEVLDLTTLSGTRLGLAVVGVLARKHGLTVSFRPSSRGGTGVVVMIPRQLITAPRSVVAPPAVADSADTVTAGLPTVVPSRLPALLSPEANATSAGTTGKVGSAAGAATARIAVDPVTEFISLPQRKPEHPARLDASHAAASARAAGAAREAAPDATTVASAVPSPALAADADGSTDEAGAPPLLTLPKRERGQSLAASARAAALLAAPPRTHRPRRNSSANFAAFRRAMRAAGTNHVRPAGPAPGRAGALVTAAATGTTASPSTAPGDADVPDGTGEPDQQDT
ncbi:ATP-binding region ATPase domain protein [Parafrankia sp. EAN1pec]|uniref:ATP-binding protein n=1 Tax=Parafrankia sp. (strain EAN1pec) TaxID=298653 RepID=UPI0000543F21|nr:ATP-binding region ATPase domain protein [Frankia sp. EAN1pec]